jgi:hypothetical protein
MNISSELTTLLWRKSLALLLTEVSLITSLEALWLLTRRITLKLTLRGLTLLIILTALLVLSEAPAAWVGEHQWRHQKQGKQWQQSAFNRHNNHGHPPPTFQKPKNQ